MQDVEVLESISWQGTMVKQDQSFDFKKLRVLIWVTALSNPKAYVDNLDLLLSLASQCSKLEAIIIENYGNSIGLPHILPTNIASTLQRRILDLCCVCASLKILNLVGLEFLEQLPKGFGSRHTLLRLNLSLCSSFAALPTEIGNFSSMTTLNLSRCSSLKAIPNEVGNLSSLTSLNLSECLRLQALPWEVGNLSSLTTLDLKRCSNFEDLPKEVRNLSSLTTLDLEGCSRLKDCQRNWKTCLH